MADAASLKPDAPTQSVKKVYTKPKLTKLGSFREIALAGGDMEEVKDRLRCLRRFQR